MQVLSDDLLSSLKNIKLSSPISFSRPHSNVKTDDSYKPKLLMPSLFIVSPKNGINIKTAPTSLNTSQEQRLEKMTPEIAYELELQMVQRRQNTFDIMEIPHEMDSVNAVMLFLKSKNYDNEFYVNQRGWVILKENIYHQHEINLIKTYRFEGDSNPSDEAIIYLIIADDGTIGYSLDGYGISSNHDHDRYVEFIRKLSFLKNIS